MSFTTNRNFTYIMIIMKKNQILSVFTLTVLLAFSVLFTSCSNDDEKDMIDLPGQIPGLGNNKDELAGSEFKLPEGLQLDGDILSASVQDFTEIGENDKARGSGSAEANLKLSLKNLTDKDIEVEFPAGLIVKSLSGEYQNGVLLKKTKTTVPANETHSFRLHMYGGNESLRASSVTITEKYKFAVISNSSLIVDLCNRLANKKINYEENRGNINTYYPAYTTTVQLALWRITDRNGLLESNIDGIDSLPDSSK